MQPEAGRPARGGRARGGAGRAAAAPPVTLQRLFGAGALQPLQACAVAMAQQAADPSLALELQARLAARAGQGPRVRTCPRASHACATAAHARAPCGPAGDPPEYAKLLATTMVVVPPTAPAPPPHLSLSRVLSQEEVRAWACVRV